MFANVRHYQPCLLNIGSKEGKSCELYLIQDTLLPSKSCTGHMAECSPVITKTEPYHALGATTSRRRDHDHRVSIDVKEFSDPFSGHILEWIPSDSLSARTLERVLGGMGKLSEESKGDSFSTIR